MSKSTAPLQGIAFRAFDLLNNHPGGCLEIRSCRLPCVSTSLGCANPAHPSPCVPKNQGGAIITRGLLCASPPRENVGVLLFVEFSHLCKTHLTDAGPALVLESFLGAEQPATARDRYRTFRPEGNHNKKVRQTRGFWLAAWGRYSTNQRYARTTKARSVSTLLLSGCTPSTGPLRNATAASPASPRGTVAANMQKKKREECQRPDASVCLFTHDRMATRFKG